MTVGTGHTDADDPVRVFIADGDSRVCHALYALLEADPHAVVVGRTATAKDILEHVERLHAAVILLDLGLSSPEPALSLIQALTRSQAHVVVAMSPHGHLRESALQAGAFAFIEKGEMPEAVLEALRRATVHATELHVEETPSAQA